MINVRLSGGLGNQLFQLACALRFSGYDINLIGVYVDALNSYNAEREFELSRICDINPAPSQSFASIIFKTRLARLIKFNDFFINDSNYVSGPLKIRSDVFLDGYFQYEQDWRVFARSASLIKKMLRNEFTQKKQVGLVIHARGGDFLRNELSHNHQIEFYSNILNNGYISEYNTGILCCSDPSYGALIRDFFQSHGVELAYRAGKDEHWVDDFNLMMNAKFVVGSRSTFAWWATLLGETSSVFPSDFTIGTQRNLYHPWERYNCK